MSQTKESKDAKTPAADAKPDAKGDGKGGKPRVYALAQELKLDTKAMLDICQELGFAGITNQLKSLEPDQVEAIRQRIKRGPTSKAAPAAATAAPGVTPAAAKPPALPAKIDAKIPTIAKPKPPAKAAATPALPVEAPAAVVPPVVVEVAPPVVQPVATVPEVVKPVEVVPAAVVAPVVPPVAPVTPPVAVVTPPVSPKLPATQPNRVPPIGANTGRPQNLNPTRPQNLNTPRPPATPPAASTAPAVGPNVTAPATTLPGVTPASAGLVQPPAPVDVPPAPLPTPPAPPVAVTPAPAPPAPVAPPPAAVVRPPVANPPVGTTPPARPIGAPPAGGGGFRPSGAGTVPPNAGQRPTNLNAPRGPNPNPGMSTGPRPANPPAAVPGQPTPSGRTAPNPGPPTRQGPGNSARTGPGGPAFQSRPDDRRPGQFGPSGSATPGGAPQGRPGMAPPQVGPPGAASKTVKLTPEQIARLRQLESVRGGGKVTINEVERVTTAPIPQVPNPAQPNTGARPMPGRPGFAATPITTEAGGGEDGRGAPGGGVAVPGRDQRHKARSDKGRNDRRSATDVRSVNIGPNGRVDMIDRFRHIKKQKGRSHVKQPVVVTGGKVEIPTPITVRTLSEAIGMKVGELLLKLKNLTNSLYSINSSLEFATAELIATERNIELVAKNQETAEEETLRKLKQQTEASDDANTTLRPPVVTIMGHVDHGKTSLLDRIRQEYGHSSDVVASETGGITQVLRAWRVEKDGKSTTFLDTPGHEAFTKMRARGANVTDIAVIVVSAVDGIMPQTAEAVAHAKAAEVDIIVAINKVDLPGANAEKVKNRLFELELVAEDLGGDVPVILTSAVTGEGIAELLDSIALLAEFAELKADATLPGSGTCLEGYKEEQKGVVATMLVQNGTLRKGDTILCGMTFGRVRAMYDDLGQPIDEAGPSTPVSFIGLDEVPDADDPFFVVDDVATAREIAEKRKDRRSELDRHKFTAVSLDQLREQNAKAKVSELKVILKAEARGSVEAIKKELEKLVHEEVAVRLLHSGIGAITESDMQLALTSPEDTLIVGFNVTTDDAAMRLAEERDISVREYQIIYNLIDDVRAALEGRLKPSEEVVHLGRAVVRDTFKNSKIGMIAGCFVTSGTLERNARVRVIRDGVVLYPQGEKVAGLDSLRRFKDDAKEVREGFECGLKITNFDDVKIGDVIEAFKIEIRKRTL